ncbi:MAG: hypothetical protein PHO01_06125 [Desulfotomaculaceae bacterium]|nr:hypothetical protein [Desulfotomaculaceae bacterium]
MPDNCTQPDVFYFKNGAEGECTNTKVRPHPVKRGAIVKVPVVLAELSVQINVDSLITLPEPAFEVKQIKKNLKLTQCILAQNTNKLFLRGFVRKNITYSTRDCSNHEGFCGDIRHYTVDVPWSCVTPVKFNVRKPAPPLLNGSEEFQYLRKKELGPEFAGKDFLESGDFSEFNQVSTELFNELPFCEIISATITEFDEFLGRKRPHGVIPFEEFEFRTIEEKMVIELTLKVLQKRQVAVSAFKDKDCYEGCDEKMLDGKKPETAPAEIQQVADLVEALENVGWKKA